MHKNRELRGFTVDANLCYTRDLGQHFGNYLAFHPCCKTGTVRCSPLIFRLSSQTCRRNGQKKGNLLSSWRKVLYKASFYQIFTNNLPSFQGGCQTCILPLALLWEVTKDTGLRMAFGEPVKSQSQS